MKDFWRKGIWLRVVVHLLGWLPLALLGFDALAGRLSVNPIQDIEQRLGRAALYFLLAALAVTPLATLTGWRILAPRRRALGLYAFLYASLHFTTFAAVDYGFNFGEILRLIGEKPFILLGFTAGLLLVPLSVTSFDYFMRRMGKRWKLLHRLVYIIAPIVVIHYAWARKGDLFALSGDILQPLLWGALVLILLALRIPAIRKEVSGLRQRIISGKPLRARPDNR